MELWPKCSPQCLTLYSCSWCYAHTVGLSPSNNSLIVKISLFPSTSFFPQLPFSLYLPFQFFQTEYFLFKSNNSALLLKGGLHIWNQCSKAISINGWVLSHPHLHQMNALEHSSLFVDSWQHWNVARHVSAESLALDLNCTNCFHLLPNTDS